MNKKEERLDQFFAVLKSASAASEDQPEASLQHQVPVADDFEGRILSRIRWENAHSMPFLAARWLPSLSLLALILAGLLWTNLTSGVVKAPSEMLAGESLITYYYGLALNP